MSRIFMTGLESGAFPDKMSPSGSVISSLHARTGAYSIRATSSIHGALIRLPSEHSELYLRVGVFPPTGESGEGNGPFVHFQRALESRALVWLRADGYTLSARVRTGFNTSSTLASGGSLSPNVWNCVEIRVRLGSDGAFVVQLEGIVVINYIGSVLPHYTGPIGLVSLNAVIGEGSTDGGTMPGHMDDVAINSTAGTINNAWPGRGGIYLARPAGVGALSEFTPDANANWQQIRDIPPDEDASFVQSNVLGHSDLYTTGGIVPTDGTITAAQWLSRARLTEVGVGNIQPLVRHAGVNYVGPVLGVDQGYRYNSNIMELAPDGTDWTVAKVNALQIGQQVA